jgi:protein TonB
MSTDEPAPLLDAVFGDQRGAKRGSRALLAWTIALALHAALFFLARLSGPSLETWSARIAAMVHRDLNANAPTAIETLKPAAPKPEPEPNPEPARPPPPLAAAPVRARAPQPPAAPAQAAQIIAADAPADLTADTFVTGSASAYAGGATTSTGTSTEAVSRSSLETPAPPAVKPATNAPVQAVSLTSEQWHCPWPAAALAQDLYEQFVIVRAWVRADGSVERASVISDPGYGFGAAAITCALHTRFNPARNARGEALRALSPPIRVRFTR